MINFLGIDPDKDQMDKAAAFLLPRDLIKREKTILAWKYWLSLPVRAIKKVVKMIFYQ